MQYVNVGRTGLKISRICLGCMSFGTTDEWTVEIDEARTIVERAWDLGINFFDTANVYSKGRSEEILGELLKDVRQDAIIATKVYEAMGEGPNDRGLSRRHILRQIEASLRRLQTDYIDLYQVHRWDYDTPINETLVTMTDLIHNGMVRYIGASSMHAWQFAKALCTSDRFGLERFESMQNHYNLCYREEEREMIPLCRDQQIAILPWSPLARGFLTGKYKRNITPNSTRSRADKPLIERYFKPEDFDILECVEEIAAEKDVEPAQISLAWLLENGITAPVIGATKVNHVKDAVEALEIRLTADDMKRLQEPYRLHPIIGHQ